MLTGTNPQERLFLIAYWNESTGTLFLIANMKPYGEYHDILLVTWDKSVSMNLSASDRNLT